eukprot:9293456-Alexandrium_andersonii.AAC.1
MRGPGHRGRILSRIAGWRVGRSWRRRPREHSGAGAARNPGACRLRRLTQSVRQVHVDPLVSSRHAGVPGGP